LVRNSVVLAVYLLFSVACFLTVHEHYGIASINGMAVAAVCYIIGSKLSK